MNCNEVILSQIEEHKDRLEVILAMYFEIIDDLVGLDEIPHDWEMLPELFYMFYITIGRDFESKVEDLFVTIIDLLDAAFIPKISRDDLRSELCTDEALAYIHLLDCTKKLVSQYGDDLFDDAENGRIYIQNEVFICMEKIMKDMSILMNMEIFSEQKTVIENYVPQWQLDYFISNNPNYEWPDNWIDELEVGQDDTVYN